MKRTLATVLTVAFLLALIPGITGCKIIPKKWYEETLNYYSDGIKNGFKESYSNLSVPDDLKDSSKKKGYLLIDLDKDGVNELLIGIIHLCYDNVIEMDSGIEYNKPTFMRWNQKSNSFTVIDGEGKFLPAKWELTPFE